MFKKILSVAVLVLSSVSTVLADGIHLKSGELGEGEEYLIGADKDKSGADNVIEVIQTVANNILYFVAGAAVLVLIAAAIKLARSTGNEEEMETAKKTITWTIAGILVVMLSYALVKTVITFIFTAAPA